MNNNILQSVFRSQGGFAALALRIPVGIIFIAHGAQKLFGLFGGYGLEGTGQWMTSIGLEPGYLLALLVGSAEFFGRNSVINWSVYTASRRCISHHYVRRYFECACHPRFIYGK